MLRSSSSGRWHLVRCPSRRRHTAIRSVSSQIAVALIPAFPRGDNEDLNVRAPRDGTGGLLPDLHVRVPTDGPGDLLPGLVVWSGGANGVAQEEGREEPWRDKIARVARAACASGVRRNLKEPRHGVHAVDHGGYFPNGGEVQALAL